MSDKQKQSDKFTSTPEESEQLLAYWQKQINKIVEQSDSEENTEKSN